MILPLCNIIQIKSKNKMLMLIETMAHTHTHKWQEYRKIIFHFRNENWYCHYMACRTDEVNNWNEKNEKYE